MPYICPRDATVIRKSRYIQQASVASRVQLHNPTIDPDSNDAAHRAHHACLLYERQDDPCLNPDETHSFLDHHDRNLHLYLRLHLRLHPHLHLHS